jgi:hypothetical protein
MYDIPTEKPVTVRPPGSALRRGRYWDEAPNGALIIFSETAPADERLVRGMLECTLDAHARLQPMSCRVVLSVDPTIALRLWQDGRLDVCQLAAASERDQQIVIPDFFLSGRDGARISFPLSILPYTPRPRFGFLVG